MYPDKFKFKESKLNLTREMKNKYPEKFKEAKALNEKIANEKCNIRIIQDNENFIVFFEEIYSIVDITMITEVHLTDLDQIDWLINELTTPDFTKWDLSKMHNDRQSMEKGK